MDVRSKVPVWKPTSAIKPSMAWGAQNLISTQVARGAAPRAARREPRRTSHCFEAPCTAASRDGGKARARYGAGAVAHRSEKRLPSRPTHLYQLPKANSAVGEGLPQSSATPEQDSENASGARLSLPKHGTSTA